MTCRCNMCGGKNAGRIARGSYIRVGIRVDERIHKGSFKKADRKLRRTREKRVWTNG